jgi:hypothetical protein
MIVISNQGNNLCQEKVDLIELKLSSNKCNNIKRIIDKKIRIKNSLKLPKKCGINFTKLCQLFKLKFHISWKITNKITKI